MQFALFFFHLCLHATWRSLVESASFFIWQNKARKINEASSGRKKGDIAANFGTAEHALHRSWKLFLRRCPWNARSRCNQLQGPWEGIVHVISRHAYEENASQQKHATIEGTWVCLHTSRCWWKRFRGRRCCEIRRTCYSSYLGAAIV